MFCLKESKLRWTTRTSQLLCLDIERQPKHAERSSRPTILVLFLLVSTQALAVLTPGRRVVGFTNA